MRTVAFLTLAGLVVLGGTRPAEAREHQQIMAEIRMLQEQTQQLHHALIRLAQTLDGMGKRIDTQSETTRRGFADQRLLVDSLADDVRVVRERLDDSTVRLNSLSQELDALRHSVASAARPMPPPGADAFPSGTTPGPDAPPPADEPGEAPEPAADDPEPGEAPVALTPAAPAIPPGASPSRMYDSAYADYASGQWALAIAGFDSFLRTFPQSDLADDAQFFIGEAYAMDEQLRDAVTAYDRVITSYPDGDKVPDALYKKGIALSRLGDSARAREAFETLIESHPRSEAAALARQVLDGMSRRQQ